MTALHTREGVLFTGAARTDEKGKPFFTQPRKCSRCGGHGRSDRWAFTGFTCFDCGGAGTLAGEVTIRLYTAEELARLNATRDKARARKAAKQEAEARKRADEAAARACEFRAQHGALLSRAWAYLGSRYGWDDNGEEVGDDAHFDFVHDIITRAERANAISEAQGEAVEAAIRRYDDEQARKAAARHVGREGERLKLDVTVVRIAQIERAAFNAPWRSELVCISTLRDAAGNTLVVKSPSFWPQQGAALTIKGTVKRHSEYRGEAQTELSRVLVL